MSRNRSIDIAKGIGILLVVLGHNWIVAHEKTLLFQMIYSFHMPLFFLLSGVFLNTAQRFPSFLRSKADALIKPYTVVLVLLGVLKIAAGITTPSRYFPGVLYGVGATIDWTPLWFLPSLFITMVFAWLLLNTLRDERYPTVGLSAIIVALFLLGDATITAYSDIPFTPTPHFPLLAPGNTRLTGLPFSLDMLPFSAACLLLGYLCRRQLQEMQFQPRYLMAATVIFIASHLLFSYPTDLNARVYGHWLLTPLRALSGIYIVLELSALIAKHKLAAPALAYLGQASLFILIFHAAVEWSAFGRLVTLFPKYKYAIGVLTCIGGVALPLILLEISQRISIMSRLLLPWRARGNAIKL